MIRKYLSGAEKRKKLVAEAKIVANEIRVSAEFPEKRKSKQKRFFDEATIDEEGQSTTNNENNGEVVFKREVFYVLLDSVIAGLTTRYSAVKQINCQLNDLKAIHIANFGEEQLHPMSLLNNLHKNKL